jgi:hypothetical protein
MPGNFSIDDDKDFANGITIPWKMPVNFTYEYNCYKNLSEKQETLAFGLFLR